MRQINIRVDDEQYAGIEARAAAAGMTVPQYAQQVVADEANDLRHRFLAAAAHFSAEWADAFAIEFGDPGVRGGAAPGDTNSGAGSGTAAAGHRDAA